MIKAKIIIPVLMLFLMSCVSKPSPEKALSNEPLEESTPKKDSSYTLNLNCSTIDSLVLHHERCELIEHLVDQGLSANFCLNNVITILQTETGILSRAKFDDLTGYSYHYEKHYFEDMQKYADYYSCK